MEGSARARWLRRKNERAMRRLRAILERRARRGRRAARDGRRRIDCRVACPAACASSRSSLLALLAALALGACGDSHTRVTTGTYAGESGPNAPYLNVGPLIYEVQLSRELNPSTPRTPPTCRASRRPSASSSPARSGSRCSCRSTTTPRSHLPAASEHHDQRHPGQHLHARSLPARPTSSPTAAGCVPAKARLPAPDTVAADGPTQGALLLYKIQIVSLDNRPLELKIVDPHEPAADGLRRARRLAVRPLVSELASAVSWPAAGPASSTCAGDRRRGRAAGAVFDQQHAHRRCAGAAPGRTRRTRRRCCWLRLAALTAFARCRFPGRFAPSPRDSLRR